MSQREKYPLINGFSLFYDKEKVIPLLNGLPGNMGEKIKQFIQNKAYTHALTDFKSCGKNKKYKFFKIKSPSIKISYEDLENCWIVYSITPA